MCYDKSDMSTVIGASTASKMDIVAQFFACFDNFFNFEYFIAAYIWHHKRFRLDAIMHIESLHHKILQNKNRSIDKIQYTIQSQIGKKTHKCHRSKAIYTWMRQMQRIMTMDRDDERKKKDERERERKKFKKRKMRGKEKWKRGEGERKKNVICKTNMNEKREEKEKRREEEKIEIYWSEKKWKNKKGRHREGRVEAF